MHILDFGILISILDLWVSRYQKYPLCPLKVYSLSTCFTGFVPGKPFLVSTNTGRKVYLKEHLLLWTFSVRVIIFRISSFFVFDYFGAGTSLCSMCVVASSNERPPPLLYSSSLKAPVYLVDYRTLEIERLGLSVYLIPSHKGLRVFIYSLGCMFSHLSGGQSPAISQVLILETKACVPVGCMYPTYPMFLPVAWWMFRSFCSFQSHKFRVSLNGFAVSDTLMIREEVLLIQQLLSASCL